jgi:hypothetical protein
MISISLLMRKFWPITRTAKTYNCWRIVGIHYDTEKSKLILTQPDVKAYSGILSKFGYETWNVLRESVKTLYKVDKDEE